MKYIFYVLFLFSIIALNPKIVLSQVSVSNLAEYQVGNLPNTEPKNLSSFYNQLQVSYQNSNLNFGLRLESFQASALDRKYNKFSQRYLEYQRDWFRIRIGNYYGILGRGLVFRAFELPGVVKEDEAFRVRHALSRDVDGFLAEANWKFLQLTLLRGESLNSSLPPTFEDNNRSLGIVEGGQLKIKPVNWITVGGIYARYTPPARSAFEVGAAILGLSLSPLLSKTSLNDLSIDFYSEYAQRQGTKENLFSTRDKDPHALYFSANLIYKNLGLSIEHKDYHDFNFRMNDPPPLVKEHSFYLLNRATHVLLSEDETGNQVELTYTLPYRTILTANYTRAENRISPISNFISEEKFIGIDVYLKEYLLTRLFLDKSMDEFPAKSIADRVTSGINLEWQLNEANSLTLDLQAQEFSRTYDPQKYNEFYGSLTFARSPKFAISLIGQRSNDPLEADDPRTAQIETDPKYWLSITTNHQITDEHEIFLFYGKRRGGPACVAGTCYEVLAFEGFEIRFISRFL